MKKLFLVQVAGFTFTAILGTLLHFLYDFTGQSLLVAPFSAVNESTFEHIKLLFFPALIFAVIQYFWVGKEYKNFWCVKLLGIIIGSLLIPVTFYTLSGVFGQTAGWVNVLLFFLCAGISFYLEHVLLQAGKPTCITPIIPVIILIILAVSFMLFTFFTPKIPLFLDPLTLSYGV